MRRRQKRWLLLLLLLLLLLQQLQLQLLPQPEAEVPAAEKSQGRVSLPLQVLLLKGSAIAETCYAEACQLVRGCVCC